MSEYFANFPEVVTNDGKSITNLCLRVDFFNKIKNNASLFEELQIRDGERPEDIALLAYDDPNLYWVILWTNDIKNTYTDWPLKSDRLQDFVAEKYGATHVYDVHHYETIKGSDLGIGVIVNQGTAFSQSVSNFDYEDGVNESKRRIKILRSAYVNQVLQEYSKIF